jgi:hypothetical protein
MVDEVANVPDSRIRRPEIYLIKNKSEKRKKNKGSSWDGLD